MILSEKDKNRFWSKVAAGGRDACWNWLAAKQKSGHGVFSLNCKFILAHRVSYFLANKKLPAPGLFVLHDCENPSCVNPSHLIEGTNKQNQLYPNCLKKSKGKKAWWLTKYEPHPRLGTKHNSSTKNKLRKISQTRKRHEQGYFV